MNQFIDRPLAILVNICDEIDLIADNEDMPSEEFVQQAISATPSGRLVTRLEIANMVCLLCTDAFANMTGQMIVLDGGRSIPRIEGGHLE